MTEYSQSYMTFAESLLNSNKELIVHWAQDNSNRELSESCQMILEAGQK